MILGIIIEKRAGSKSLFLVGVEMFLVDSGVDFVKLYYIGMDLLQEALAQKNSRYDGIG